MASSEMNGLRIYVHVSEGETLGSRRVFYSRRSDGPYYLWRYEEKVGQWRGSRVHDTHFAPRDLTMTRWSIVPLTLQNKLGEHYLE
jgi:hypothetical protein